MKSFSSPALNKLPDITTLKESGYTAMYEQILKELLAVDSLGISGSTKSELIAALNNQKDLLYNLGARSPQEYLVVYLLIVDLVQKYDKRKSLFDEGVNHLKGKIEDKDTPPYTKDILQNLLSQITTKHGDAIDTLQLFTNGYRSWIATHTATMKEYFPALEGMRVREGFEPLGGGYASDKDGVVYCQGIKTEIQRNGFESLRGGYASDKDGVYCEGNKTEMQKDSFTYLGGGYATDKDGVYYEGIKTEIQRNGFESLRGGYASDKDGVYCEGNKTEMQKDSFTYLGGGYATNSTGIVYCKGIKTDMKINGFVDLGGGYATNSTGIVYCKGIKTDMKINGFVDLGGGYATNSTGIVYCKGIKTDMKINGFVDLGGGYAVYNNSLLYCKGVLGGVLKSQN